MQSVTLVSALVASVAYATSFKLELTENDAVWATTDITVDWMVDTTESIKMEVKGEFALDDTADDFVW